MIITFFIGVVIFGCGLGLMRLNEANATRPRNMKWYSFSMAGVFEIVYGGLLTIGGIGMVLSLFAWMLSFMFGGSGAVVPPIP